jgi:hypothetical protein
MISKKAFITYIAVLLLLVITTLLALIDGGYHMEGGSIAGIALGSSITSLLPFFLSRFLFKKYESHPTEKKGLKTQGLIVYLFCFPVKLLVIWSNVDLLINGGTGWAFG